MEILPNDTLSYFPSSLSIEDREKGIIFTSFACELFHKFLDKEKSKEEKEEVPRAGETNVPTLPSQKAYWKKLDDWDNCAAEQMENMLLNFCMYRPEVIKSMFAKHQEYLTPLMPIRSSSKSSSPVSTASTLTPQILKEEVRLEKDSDSSVVVNQDDSWSGDDQQTTTKSASPLKRMKSILKLPESKDTNVQLHHRWSTIDSQTNGNHKVEFFLPGRARRMAEFSDPSLLGLKDAKPKPISRSHGLLHTNPKKRLQRRPSRRVTGANRRVSNLGTVKNFKEELDNASDAEKNDVSSDSFESLDKTEEKLLRRHRDSIVRSPIMNTMQLRKFSVCSPLSDTNVRLPAVNADHRLVTDSFVLDKTPEIDEGLVSRSLGGVELAKLAVASKAGLPMPKKMKLTRKGELLRKLTSMGGAKSPENNIRSIRDLSRLGIASPSPKSKGITTVKRRMSFNKSLA